MVVLAAGLAGLGGKFLLDGISGFLQDKREREYLDEQRRYLETDLTNMLASQGITSESIVNQAVNRQMSGAYMQQKQQRRNRFLNDVDNLLANTGSFLSYKNIF